MPVARIAGIGQQDLLVSIDEERHDQEQRGRRPGGHDHAFRRDDDAEALGIMPCDRLAQFRGAQRRRVVDAAIGQGGLRGGKDRRRRRKVGLADLHVHDRAAGRLERARGRLHLHDMERLDRGDTGRGGMAEIHRWD